MPDKVNILPGDGLITTFDPPAMHIKPQSESTLLGRPQGGGSGPVLPITLGSGLTMTGDVLSASGGGGGGVTSYEMKKAVLYGS